MTESYFTPVSLNEMLECIHKVILSPENELNGEEMIYDVEYIAEDGTNLPRNTIIFHVVKLDGKKGEEETGCLYVTPKRRKYLM